MSVRLEEHYIQTNGITLHVVSAGPPDGPLVILLHGFPEFWYGWQKQIPALVAAGYRVVAPDQRGYNRSDKPPGIAAYRGDRLAADIVGLLDALGREKAAVVGHDWGAMIAWGLGILHPARLSRLVILNVPHPAVFLRHLATDPRQQVRSLYAAFFQLPLLPEWLIRQGNWWLSRQSLRLTSRPGTFTPADLRRYRRAWAQPGAGTAMLNWYRAGIRHLPPHPADLRIHVPTLVIWGARDQFLRRQMAPESVACCDDGRLVFVEEATHWVHHEEPARVNRLILDFLAHNTGRPG